MRDDEVHKTFGKTGAKNKIATNRRLSARRSIYGGALKPKKRPDGHPLGTKRPEKGGLPAAIRDAKVKVRDEGVDVTYPEPTGHFHRGRQKRRIIGMDRAEYRQALNAVLAAIEADDAGGALK